MPKSPSPHVFGATPLKPTLERYDDALVRQVAAKLIRPRNEWPVADLIERCVAAADNAVMIDRRLQELDVPCRRLLALVGRSRQMRWRLGGLLELLAALGHAEGPRPVFALFEAGLLYPVLAETGPQLRGFEEWLGQAGSTGFTIFAPPLAALRAAGEDLGLPDLSAPCSVVGSPHEADGLEWPLRLTALWQQVAAAPLRRTQNGEFFKRDLDRLRGDALLNGPAADSLAELPDAGLLAVTLARHTGLVREHDGELSAAAALEVWQDGLPATLASFWAALPLLHDWDPQGGWRGSQAGGNPFPSASLLALLLLAQLPEDAWAAPEEVGQWVVEHHPFWAEDSVRPSQLRNWAPTFLLGLAYQFRWLQAARDAEDGWRVRLSPLGRWLAGVAEAPPPETPFKQTLLVQPNLEVLAYRQGLTPNLIVRLATFATWKTLGAACTLQLDPESVYRALETGLTFQGIVQTLEQHGTRTLPGPVVESLRTWSNKRERLRIYPAAAILEFNSPEDLQEALARGLPAVRLTDRLAVVANESDIDYRHFRLAGTRDYGLPPERCVLVEPDGVTLTVDVARSDLLLETEMGRFAEPIQRAGANGRRQYRLTPASLTAGRAAGFGLTMLETWFGQRAGEPLSASARLLLTGPELPPPELKRHLVLHVVTEELADGLLQWPATRPLIQTRLGPTALVVAEADVGKLRQQLQALGMAWAATVD